MNFQINNNTTNITWDQNTLKSKLEGLSHLEDKQSGWVQGELNISSSGPISRFFWSLIGKRFETLRKSFYGVNLAKSQNILNQLQPQINQSRNKALIELFRRAVD